MRRESRTVTTTGKAGPTCEQPNAEGAIVSEELQLSEADSRKKDAEPVNGPPATRFAVTEGRQVMDGPSVSTTVTRLLQVPALPAESVYLHD